MGDFIKLELKPLEKSTKGLSSLEARSRLKDFGKNKIVPDDFHSNLSKFLKFFQDPMGLMMLGLALIYFLLGNRIDAYIMLIAFIPVSAVDVLLELRAEKALSLLSGSFQLTALIFRDGELQEILIEEIVPGDLIALEEGQTIPADGRVEMSSGLSISEASLSGESIPVNKSEADELYAGTSVLSGRGTYVVHATGKKTKFGKIIDLLQSTDESRTPLQKKINMIVIKVVKIAAVLVICLFLLEVMRGKSLLQSLLISLTFGMAAVPEEFPLVFTLYLSIGAWRLTKKGVLVKSLPSVETLGAVDVICTDKTGTLTEGKFQLNKIIPFKNISEPDLWKFATLACEPIIVDSMELAIREKSVEKFDTLGWTLVHDYPFEIEGKHMSHAWMHTAGEMLVTMKGAVEGVLFHCIDSFEDKSEILKKTEELSSQGYRLLGLAGKKGTIYGNRDKDEMGLSFFGILVFSDPVRITAKKAIEDCQSEGIIVKMITGDHPLTAHAIADQLGLNHTHDALFTGPELKRLSSNERLLAFRKGAIFSRMTPEQKYDLVMALKNDGKIVAMTGDGVNDTPAMKIADIGISMGENATDAARATARMVLIKNDFNGIVQAMIEGRRIFSNLRKSFSYLISFHVPVVLLSLLPPLLNLNEILMPIHIILLELVVHPVSAFTFENLQDDNKRGEKGIVSKKSFISSLLAGVLVSFIALLVFILMNDFSIEEKRTAALSVVLFGNVGFVLLETWPLFNKRLVVTITLLAIVSVLISVIPFLSSHLHLSALPKKWLLFCLGLGIISSLPSWLFKRYSSVS